MTRRSHPSSRAPDGSSPSRARGGSLDSRLAGLLAGAGALQTLTLELAQARGVNPDLIRREEAPYRDAAHEAGGVRRMVSRRTLPQPVPQPRSDPR